MARILVVREERCLGCKSCVIQCAMAHSNCGTLAEAVASADRPQSRLHVEALGDIAMPLQCRHCEDAPCASVCPTEGITRQDEQAVPVLLDQERCIGCRQCMLACPFGVIEMSRDGKAMIKCDLCIERTAAGQEPACVASCPTKALAFEELTDVLKQRRKEAVRQLARGPEAKT